jgi:hypothetical protein
MVHRNGHQREVATHMLRARHASCVVIQGMVVKCCCAMVVIADSTGIV